jgi:hypothetical protein
MKEQKKYSTINVQRSMFKEGKLTKQAGERAGLLMHSLPDLDLARRSSYYFPAAKGIS